MLSANQKEGKCDLKGPSGRPKPHQNVKYGSTTVTGTEAKYSEDNKPERAHLQLAHSVLSTSSCARLFLLRVVTFRPPALYLKLLVPLIIAVLIRTAVTRSTWQASDFSLDSANLVKSSMVDADSKFSVEGDKKWPWLFLNRMETWDRSLQRNPLYSKTKAENPITWGMSNWQENLL